MYDWFDVVVQMDGVCWTLGTWCVKERSRCVMVVRSMRFWNMNLVFVVVEWCMQMVLMLLMDCA